MDALSKKNKRSRGLDSDSDDGPPPDPDEAPPQPTVKKEKKPTGEARDVQVAARKVEGQNLQGGLSTIRREMLTAIHAEADEAWVDLEFHHLEVRHPFTRCLSRRRTKTAVVRVNRGIRGTFFSEYRSS